MPRNSSMPRSSNRQRRLRDLSALAALCVLYALSVLMYSRVRPLWHDELFTFYIAGLPRLAAMLHTLRTVDLNPPVSYLLTRLSFALFGHSTLAARLPEMAGFGLAMLCLFLFVRRRLGSTYALLAATALFCGRGFEDVAAEARPYGLLLGLTALLLVLWQLRREAWQLRRETSMASETLGKMRGLLPAIFVTAAALVFTHLLAMIVIGILLLVALLPLLQRRRCDWRMLATIAAAALLGMFNLHIVHDHNAALYPAAFVPTWAVTVAWYVLHLRRETGALAAAILLALIVNRATTGSARQPRTASPGPDAAAARLASEELLAAWLLTLVPLGLMLHAMQQHSAYFPRYGCVGTLGIALLLAHYTAKFSRHSRVAACVAIAMLFILSSRWTLPVEALQHPSRLFHSEPVIAACDICRVTGARHPQYPFVLADAISFIEMSHREPAAFTRNVYFLEDDAAAAKFAHASIFNHEEIEVALFGLPSHAIAYADFRAHPQCFYVLANPSFPEEWLLAQLRADGYRLQPLGWYAGSYRDHDLFVATPPGHAACTP
jgi:hypothetical protein